LSAADIYRLGISASAAVGARILQRPGGLRDLETRALREAAAGRLTPVIGQRFDLADAAAAHQAVESRSTTGKTVLHASPGDGTPYGRYRATEVPKTDMDSLLVTCYLAELALRRLGRGYVGQ
jgi:hypothetical protein